jgi:hypothetical protein
VSQAAEHPDRGRAEHQVSVDDVRQLVGASTPHFSGQIVQRLRRLVAPLAADHPARVLAEREVARLTRLGFDGEFRGDATEEAMPPLPSLTLHSSEPTPGGNAH